jgi:methyltransferase (TIGR00027 family)
MKSEKASRTALFVAFGRALADAGASHVSGFHDPTARVFLSDKGKKRLAKIERQMVAGKNGFMLASARVSATLMALRTSAIDDAVRDAMTRGATQLVILGAGYDGRAWRMKELAGVRVFEVDHPATQNSKRLRVSELPPPIGSVNFVPVDFERESLDAALDAAGHDRARPTCWIWEGVVMYLTHDAMRATLAGIAARSAPASTVIVNYHTVQRRLLARIIFQLVGEPMISKWSPEEMASDLRAAGFEVHEDSGMADWVKRFAASAPGTQYGYFMRIAVARRPA